MANKPLAYIATASAETPGTGRPLGLTFEGHGLTEADALAALDRAYFLHGEESGLPHDWHVTLGLCENIAVRPIIPGAAFRNGAGMEGGR